jgi:hypothetical protein
MKSFRQYLEEAGIGHKRRAKETIDKIINMVDRGNHEAAAARLDKLHKNNPSKGFGHIATALRDPSRRDVAYDILVTHVGGDTFDALESEKAVRAVRTHMSQAKEAGFRVPNAPQKTDRYSGRRVVKPEDLLKRQEEIAAETRRGVDAAEEGKSSLQHQTELERRARIERHAQGRA